MSTTGRRGVVRATARMKEVWQELDYAQRRSLELRTGLSFDKPVRDEGGCEEIAQLEALYDLPAYDETPSHTSPSANAR